MKECPTCSRTYDDSLSFCLNDGTALISGSDGEKTLAMPQSSLPRRKSKFLLWLALTGLVILAGSGLLIGALFYTYAGRNDAVREKRRTDVNLSPAPKSSPAPKGSPAAPEKTFPAEQSSTPINEEKPTPNGNDDGDVNPIGWDTTASGFKGEAGQTYKFQCPEKGTEHIIYGSDIYTQDSSICTAAVHAGIISLERGGVVTIEYRPGRAVYGSTVRNGVKSVTWGEYPRSFVVR